MQLLRTILVLAALAPAADLAGAAELTGTVTMTLPDELLNAWEDRVEALERRVEALEAAQHPAPAPEPRSCGPAKGLFEVRGSAICDPDGKPWRYKAVNIFPNQVGGAHTSKMACWGANAVEINWHTHRADAQYTINQVRQAINTWTSLGYVAVVEWAGVPPGSTPTAVDKQQAIADMTTLAAEHKDNPRVWFVTANELMSPSTALTFDANGNPTGYVAERVDIWIDFNRSVAQAIRATGNTAPIVMNGMFWGSDRMRKKNNHQYWDGIYPQMSSLLTHWSRLSQGISNMLPGMHTYWMYQGTDLQVEAYFQAFVDSGLPLIVGEYGEDHFGPTGTSTPDHMIENARRLVDNWIAGRGVGGAAWHWSHNADSRLPDGRHNLVLASDGGSGMDINACPAVNATNLSRFGREVLRWLQSP